MATVTINAGAVLTATQTITCTSITVNGTLAYSTGNTARAVAASGNVLINSGGTITGGATGTAANTLSIGGDFTNNGVFNGSVGAGPNKINITFTGAANIAFTTSATAATTFNLITLNKGTSNTSILDFNPSNTVSFPATVRSASPTELLN